MFNSKRSYLGLMVAIPLQLAQLNDSVPCRFAYGRMGSEQKICSPVPVRTTSICEGKERFFSPLENGVGIFHQKKQVYSLVSIAQCRDAYQGKVSEFLYQIDRYRSDLSDRIRVFDPVGVWRTLLLHEKVDSDVLFRAVGFIHLLSLSGIHLYALLFVLFEVSLWIGYRFGLALIAVQAVSRFLILIIFLWAWTLTGFCFGTLRPLILLLIRTWVRKKGFKISSLLPLLILGVSECVYSWLSFHSIGGLLHYLLALGGGIAVLGVLEKKRVSSFKEHLLLALGSWMFVAVLEEVKFHEVAVLTPLLSLATVPLMSAGIYPSLLFYSFCSISWVASLLFWIERNLVLVCEYLERCGVVFWVSTHVLLGAFCFSLFLSLLPKNQRRVISGVTMLLFCMKTSLVIAGSLVDRARPKILEKPLALQIEQLDVGQGDAALISFHYGTDQEVHFGMIDTGSEHAMGVEDWFHLFSERNVRKLDFVVFSHLDEDHSGGIKKIAQAIPVGCVATSEFLIRSKGRSGLSFQSNCFPFEVFEPRPAQITRRPKPNEGMSGFKIPLQAGGTFITLGDMDAGEEVKFLNRVSVAEIQHPLYFKVSHHGSHYSSLPDFLRVLGPDEVVVSSGIGNKYGHPHSDVIRELEKEDIVVHRTDHEGSVVFKGGVGRHQEPLLLQ